MVTSLCSVGDWLSLLAQTSLATKLTVGYQAQSFALGGVVATKLLPAMVLAPLAGALADRFDRRKVMVVCDLLRCSLLISVPIVDSLWWLFAVVFLVETSSLFWIPAKDASLPNLLHRPDQVETANQISLVMTYGVAVVAASGIFSGLSALGPQLHLAVSHTGTVHVALVVTAMAYLTSAVVVATRIKEISGRARNAAPQGSPGLFRLLHDGVRFVGGTPLIRGLVLGILGAFAAGGVVIASGKPYAASLSGGDASYGMLFAAVFIGLGTGMAMAPKFAKRLPHNRLFGVAIVTAGLALILVAIAPHLWIALVTVALVGCCAGVAFLTGLTIIGSRVEDEVRGRTVAFVQSLVRVDLLASMAVVPLVIGVVQPRTLAIFGVSMRIDGTRPVLLGAGVIAAVLGLIAYRQMQHQRGEPILSDLVTVLRPATRRTAGLLIAVEGDTAADTSAQAERLAGWLGATGYNVVYEHDSAQDAARLRGVLAGASLSSLRAKALVAAAVRADAVEHRVRPALDAGAVVVMERYLDSPLTRLGVAGGMDLAELDRLADWATGKLRPDITVLLDRGPAARPADSSVAVAGNGAAAPEWYLHPAAHGDGGAAPGFGNVEHHWRVYRLLTEMAAADPDRYLVVDAEGTVDEVAERVRTALQPALTARMPVGSPDAGLVTAERP